MPWGVAAAGVAAAGSYMSAKEASKGSGTSSAPWSQQQPYLTSGFQQGQDALTSSLNLGTYSGPRVADLNSTQTGAADAAAGYASQFGMPAAQQLGTAGQQFLQYGTQFGSNAQSLYGQSQQDPTQTILANANSYANSPYADTMIDSANRDVSRDLNETTLPSLARTASGTGNTNSTRAGVESAIATRGAADRMADTAANIRSQLFSQGLTQSQNQYNQNLSNSLQANGQLLQSFQQGGNTILQGQQVAGNAYDASQAAGSLYYNQQQAKDTAAQQAFGEQQNNSLDLIGKYQSIVNGNYGGTSYTSGSGSPLGSALTGGIGAGLAAYGTYGKLGGFGTTPVSGNYTGAGNTGSGYANAGAGDYSSGGLAAAFGQP
jgi:hypothetical protein